MEALAFSLELSDMVQDEQNIGNNGAAGADNVNAVRKMTKEIGSDLKSITQLYNDYAVPFELWE